MLQDLERGRPMEIDALLGAVVELGRCWGSRCRCALGPGAGPGAGASGGVLLNSAGPADYPITFNPVRNRLASSR